MTIPRTQGRGVSLICPRKGHKDSLAPLLDRLTDDAGWACPGLMEDGSPCGYKMRRGTVASDDDPLDEVAGKVHSALAETSGPLTAALAGIRERSERPLAHAGSIPITHPGVRGLMESAADVPRLLAALDRALKLTSPFTNPTLGGTFLAAVGLQVREAVLAELAGASPRDDRDGGR